MKVVCSSSINPDNKEIIPWPMRTCSFVATNIPIIGGMLLTAPTPANIMFWQWLNQTYNAGLNYGNRNASSEQTSGDLLKAYSVAVTSAISIALGLRKVADYMLKGRTGTLAMFSVNFINYTAVTCSSCANTGVMRMKELETGVLLKDDETGAEYGMSQVAAKEAITNTLLSRMLYIIPIFYCSFFWNLGL
jgi:hypothetical protein